MQRFIISKIILIFFGLYCLAGSGQNISNDALPELLVANDGTVISNSEDWENIRRPEILELFETNVYGEIPDKVIDISYKLLKIDKNALDGQAIQKEIIATFSNGKESLEMNMLILLPKKTKKQKRRLKLWMREKGEELDQRLTLFNGCGNKGEVPPFEVALYFEAPVPRGISPEPAKGPRLFREVY